MQETPDDSYSTHDKVTKIITEQLKRNDLSADDILKLTIANRLNSLSDNNFIAAMGSNKDEKKEGLLYRLGF